MQTPPKELGMFVSEVLLDADSFNFLRSADNELIDSRCK